MTEPIDVLVRAADAGDTYLAWRWLDDVGQPRFEVLTTAAIEPALTALADALVHRRAGERGTDAAHRALTEGAFADVDRERELARLLTDAVLPPGLRAGIRQRIAAGQRVRVRLTPSPRLAHVPWDLLCVDDDDRRLLEVAEVVLEPPATVHAERAILPEPWPDVRDRPPLVIVDPVLPMRAGSHGLGQVLDRAELDRFAERVDEYVTAGRMPVTDGDQVVHCAMDRVELSAALRSPRSRLFYLGHVTSSPDEPGSAAIHLNDTVAEWGMAAPLRFPGRDGDRLDRDDHRPFAALDLLMGTSSADRETWRRYGFDEARLGHELWPMPQRVAVIACEGGADYRSAETFGLVIAMVNAGAALVTTTRWTLPADRVFRSAIGGFEAQPTTELALRVDRAHEGLDPIGELAEWQRGRLREWRSRGELADTPLVWAALTHTIAPLKQPAVVGDQQPEQ
ncbi:CHAT domain-containing protein [Nocardia sp. CA-128927]|uniref:CHAT domain-containing protein n=1 Tax=Nocardia sp. CA-128927 TaxID=3239975 RepID=UPI003D990BBF